MATRVHAHMRSSQACVTTAWPYGGRAYTPTDPTQVEAARCTLEEVQAALRANPSDSNTVYARDSARAAYMEALAALRAQYEERQSRGARYAAASERVARLKLLQTATKYFRVRL